MAHSYTGGVLLSGLLFMLATWLPATAHDLRTATPWTDKFDTVSDKVMSNFAPLAYSEKAINADMSPRISEKLFKWEGPIEVVIAGIEAPKEIAEIRRWLDRLGRVYPDRISIVPAVTPRTNIVFVLKSERYGEDMRDDLQQVLTAKYKSAIPYYPNWKTDYCQVHLFSRDITKVRPWLLLSSVWKTIPKNKHPVDLIVVAIHANFDGLEPQRFTQETRNLFRTSCIAEETLHALTGWQDIPDAERHSTMLNSGSRKEDRGKKGLEAEAAMKRQVNVPTEADILAMRVLYDNRLRRGMTESEARPVVTEILSGIQNAP